VNIITDLDGTIALDHKRAHHLHGPKCNRVVCSCTIAERNWEAYFEACHTDEPKVAVITLLTNMHVGDNKIWILSGRSMSVQEKTLKWLKKYDVPYDYLQMRSVEDRTDDHIMKIRWAKHLNLTPENTLFVLEDRQRVVDMWRANGFTCFQVASGKF
jgi:hypothetical protein